MELLNKIFICRSSGVFCKEKKIRSQQLISAWHSMHHVHSLCPSKYHVTNTSSQNFFVYQFWKNILLNHLTDYGPHMWDIYALNVLLLLHLLSLSLNHQKPEFITPSWQRHQCNYNGTTVQIHWLDVNKCNHQLNQAGFHCLLQILSHRIHNRWHFCWYINITMINNVQFVVVNYSEYSSLTSYIFLAHCVMYCMYSLKSCFTLEYFIMYSTYSNLVKTSATEQESEIIKYILNPSVLVSYMVFTGFWIKLNLLRKCPL